MKTYSVLSIVTALVILPCITRAQVAINSVSTVSTITVSGGTATQAIAAHSGSVNGVLPGNSYNVRYNNNGNVSINSFSLTGKTYLQFRGFDTIIVRRVANASEPTNGNKQHIYCQGNATIDNTTFQMPFPVAFPQVSNFNFMEKVMKDGFINRGSDNVFNNDSGSDLTFNNIERVDFVYKAGISTTATSSAGFVITERGGNDPFKIAPITAIDANGNPTAFGSVLSVPASAYGAAITNASTYVMRKDASDNTLRPFSVVPAQAIKGVFIRFSDLGIGALQKVYGYALMGNDVTATTSAQVLNFTNSTYYPTTTNNANGGMDLASAPGIFHTDLVLDVKFINASVQTKNCEQLVQWTDDDYLRVKEYQLEKSINRENYTNVATFAGGQTANFAYTDKNFKSSAYYRVKAIMNDGGFYYSGILFAKNNCGAAGVNLYPNPATDKININFDGERMNGTVSIFATDGREYGRWTVNANTSLFQADIHALPSGQYFVKISNVNGMQKSFPVVKR
ncbi:MAG: T9SS type A sorting domain-containing protein [Bacteroidetes bacterium]|nr:T9SS type A sorting domain-containing protein [Bacteroidota bacterium]